LRFIAFEFERFATRDRTETARSRTNITENHERSGPARIALRAIRATCVLTHRFDFQIVEEVLREEIFVPDGQRAFEPRRQSARFFTFDDFGYFSKQG